MGTAGAAGHQLKSKVCGAVLRGFEVADHAGHDEVCGAGDFDVADVAINDHHPRR